MKRTLPFTLMLTLVVTASADTLTTRMGMTKPSIGSTGWGVKTNNNWDVVDGKAACLVCTNAFTQSNTFNGAVALNGPLTLGAPLPPQYGGTGRDWSAVGAGSLPYFNGPGSMSTLAIGTPNQVLGVSGGLPSWGPVPAGALPVGVVFKDAYNAFTSSNTFGSTTTLTGLTQVGSGQTLALDVNGGVNIGGGPRLNPFGLWIGYGQYPDATAALKVSGGSVFDGDTTFNAAPTFATPVVIATATVSNLTVSSLTPGRIPFASTGGLLTDNPLLGFDGNRLSVVGTPGTGVLVSGGNTANPGLSIGTTDTGFNKQGNLRVVDNGVEVALFDGNQGRVYLGGGTRVDLAAPGTAALPSYNIESGGGMFSPGSSKLGWSVGPFITGFAEKMRLTDTGLAILTGADASTALDVNGTVTAQALRVPDTDAPSIHGATDTTGFGFGPGTVGLYHQGTPVLRVSDAGVDVSTDTQFNGRILASGESGSSELTGATQEPFGRLVGESLELRVDGSAGSYVFVGTTAVTVTGTPGGNVLELDSTTGIHSGTTLRQGAAVTLVAGVIDFAQVSVVDDTGFTAGAATFSDFADDDNPALQEVIDALFFGVPFNFNVSYEDDGDGHLMISQGPFGSLMIGSGSANGILGFNAGDYAPRLSVSHKNDGLTGFLFADDGGPGPFGAFGFADGRRWLNADSGSTQLYGDVGVGNNLSVGGSLSFGSINSPLVTSGDVAGSRLIVTSNGTAEFPRIKGPINGGVGIYFPGDGNMVVAQAGLVQDMLTFDLNGIFPNVLRNISNVPFIAQQGVTFNDGTTQATAFPPAGSSDGDLFFHTGSSVTTSGGLKYLNTPFGTRRRLQILPGSQTEVKAYVGGTFYDATNGIGNVGTGEDTLHMVAISSGVLNQHGDQLIFRSAGKLANTANNKRLRAYFGGVLFFDTGSIPTSSTGTWNLEGRCVRNAAPTAAQCFATMTLQDATGGTGYSGYVMVSGLDLTGNEDLTFTGEGSATDDITQELLLLEWRPGMLSDE